MLFQRPRGRLLIQTFSWTITRARCPWLDRCFRQLRVITSPL